MRLSLLSFLFLLSFLPSFSQDNFKIVSTLQQNYDFFIGSVYVEVPDGTDSVSMRRMIPPIKKSVLQNSGKDGFLRLDIHFINNTGRKLGIIITDLSYEQKINFEKFVEYRGGASHNDRGPEPIRALIRNKTIVYPKDVIGVWFGGTIQVLYRDGDAVKSRVYWIDGTPTRNTLLDVKVIKKESVTVYRRFFTTDRGKDSIDNVVNKYGDLEEHYVHPNFMYLVRRVEAGE